MAKSSVDEIRARFDADVERFSNLEAGQTAAMSGAIALELVAKAATACTPQAQSLLDVGCGTGNFTLQMLEQLPTLDVTLVDLSRPMLDRAVKRISEVSGGTIVAHQADIRELELQSEQFDIIVAAAVLHHLRTDDEWRSVFAKFYRALRPGGGVWIYDIVQSSHAAIESLMLTRYGEYLECLSDSAYRDQVLAYIEKEDTPAPLMDQLDLLRAIGFPMVDVLLKDDCFAAFGAVK